MDVRRLSILTVALAAVLAATLVGLVRPPAVEADTTPFTDIAGTTFEADIVWLYNEAITVGCSETLYCPDDVVTRGQMASFLVRMFDLTEGAGIDAFGDDDGTTHEADINRLAHAGITKGCTATEFCPDRSVLRGEMATFLARAIPLTEGPATTTSAMTTGRPMRPTSTGRRRPGSPRAATRGPSAPPAR